MNPAELTPVFDGTVDFSGSDGDVAVISFDTPYQYSGRTLVTYIFRPKSEAYSSSDCFYAFSTEKPRIFVTGYVFGDINPMDQYTYMEMSNTVPDLAVITDSRYGTLAGVVSDVNGPVCDADVRLAGARLSARTDAEGKYSFPHLSVGTHEIEVRKNGYLDTSAKFTIDAGGVTDGNINISPIVGYPLAGTVTDSSTGAPVSGATVAIKGYASYKTLSDVEGRYEFPDVYTGEYDIIVSAGGYRYWTAKIDVTEDTGFDVALVETPYPVPDVTVNIEGGNASVTWMKPEHLDFFRYDSGHADLETGYAGGLQYGVFGCAYKEKASLTSMSWYLTARGGDQEKVNVYSLLTRTECPGPNLFTLQQAFRQSQRAGAPIRSRNRWRLRTDSMWPSDVSPDFFRSASPNLPKNILLCPAPNTTQAITGPADSSPRKTPLLTAHPASQ